MILQTNNFKAIFLMLLIVTLYSCKTMKETTFWVNSIKTKTQQGKTYLSVYKGNELSKPEWELLDGEIKDFVFEEGFLQKIKVKELIHNNKIQYALIKVLEKRKDTKTRLNGKWTLKSFGGKFDFNDSTKKKPFLQIALNEKKISGNDGCNMYGAEITELTSSSIRFKNFISTRMMCPNVDLVTQFNNALRNTVAYNITANQLSLLGTQGELLAVFIHE